MTDGNLEHLVTTGAPNNAVIRRSLTRVQCIEALAPVPEQVEAAVAVAFASRVTLGGVAVSRGGAQAEMKSRTQKAESRERDNLTK